MAAPSEPGLEATIAEADHPVGTRADDTTVMETPGKELVDAMSLGQVQENLRL
jgi:hypothetical protein